MSIGRRVFPEYKKRLRVGTESKRASSNQIVPAAVPAIDHYGPFPVPLGSVCETVAVRAEKARAACNVIPPRVSSPSNATEHNWPRTTVQAILRPSGLKSG